MNIRSMCFGASNFVAKFFPAAKKTCKKMQSWTKSDVQYVGYDCARFFLRITLFGS